MSRYPTPPHSQTDSQSFGISSYQQRSDFKPIQSSSASSPSPQLRPNVLHNPKLPLNPHPSSSSQNQNQNQSRNQNQNQKPSSAASSSDQDQLKRAARAHYDLLNSWLHDPNDLSSKSPPNRTNPRDKLTRLTRQQFQELSTDVYDELCRRIGRGDRDEPTSQSSTSDAAPFLASRDDFHPKRNQARQKLATLPRTRFKDLASDVFYELERRYPEFAQSDLSPQPGYNTPLPSRNKLNQFGTEPPRQIPLPSQPSTRTPNLPPNTSGSAGLIKTDLVVPDKSTLVIENNDDTFDHQTPIDPPKLDSFRNAPVEPFKPLLSSSPLAQSPPNSRPRSGSLSSLKYITSNNNPNHLRHGSETHLAANHPPLPRDRTNSNASKVSLEGYDRRISLMQNKIMTLEKELREAQLNRVQSRTSAVRLEECEQEIVHWKKKFEEQRQQIQSLETALQEEKTSKRKEIDSAEQEVTRLKQHISNLNQRLESTPMPGSRPTTSSRSNDSMVERLKAEVHELVDQLRQMHERHDQLLADQERLQETIHDLENSVSLHKKRYEAAKTELRELKRTSAAYQPNEFLPNEKFSSSPNGVIVDVHFNSFMSSIDELLRAGRANTTNDLISILRSVIDAVGTIDEDVQQFEANPTAVDRLSLEDRDKLDGLKHRINSTLSNLITASKNHAMSFGLSPISLLDAAASHLCFSLVELVQLVGMRKATSVEIEINESLHSNRPKYDDDDFNDESGLDSKFRPATNGNAKHNSSSPRRNDEPPAPLRINKDRERDLSRTKTSNPSLPNLSYEANEYSFKSSGLFDRKQTPGTGSSNPSGGSSQYHNHSFGGPKNLIDAKNNGSGPQRTQQMINKFEDLRSPSGFDGSNASDLRDSVSGSSSTNPDKVFDSPPRGTPNRQHQSSTSHQQSILHDSKSDEELEALKLYLETQTELIVGSIQSLLSTIRGIGTGNSRVNKKKNSEEDDDDDEAERNRKEEEENLRLSLDRIIRIVGSINERCMNPSNSNSNLNDESSSSKKLLLLLDPIHDLKLNRILKDLNENCQSLNQLKPSTFNNASLNLSKQLKQSMAAASFGVAKALKELNSHVAEV